MVENLEMTRIELLEPFGLVRYRFANRGIIGRHEPPLPHPWSANRLDRVVGDSVCAADFVVGEKLLGAGRRMALVSFPWLFTGQFHQRSREDHCQRRTTEILPAIQIARLQRIARIGSSSL